MIKGKGFKLTAAIFGIINAIFWMAISLICIAAVSIIGGFFNEIGDLMVEIGLGTEVQSALDIATYVFIGFGAISIVHFIMSILFCSWSKKRTGVGIVIILINAMFLSLLAYTTHLLVGVDLDEVAGLTSIAMGFLIALLSVNALIILFTLIYLLMNAGNKKAVETL